MQNRFTVDLNAPTTPFPHVWELCVGSDHAAMGLREDWRRQLKQCRDELGFRYVRFHGLLNDDMSVCVRASGAPSAEWSGDPGRLAYSFFNIDSVFDYLLSIGMKPFIELSFMPTVLASGAQTVFHYRGNVTPPKDYGQWGELIRRLTQHLVERYGVEEVRQWPFEVWNEPNLGAFWAGTQEEYFRLYRAAVEAIKSVDGQIPVGGPATAANAWIPELRAFCEREGVPLDFVTTHHYPTDVVLGWDWNMTPFMAKAPRGVLREMTAKARAEAGAPAAAGGLPLYYTEWNCSAGARTPWQDEPYLAAFAIKTLADNARPGDGMGLVDGYSYWTFSDLFEEMPLPSTPFHGSFGLLTIHGVPKPVYRAFELLHHAGEERLKVVGEHPTVEVLATKRADGSLQLIVTNHNVPLAPIAEEEVTVVLSGVEGAPRAALRRIDDTHANAKRRWQELGSPEYPDAATIEELKRASQFTPEELEGQQVDGAAAFTLRIPPHGVAAVEMD